MIYDVLELKVIDAFGVGKVVASDRPEFEEGELVVGLISWAEYSIVKEGSILNKLDTMGFPLSYHVGILGKLCSKQIYMHVIFRKVYEIDTLVLIFFLQDLVDLLHILASLKYVSLKKEKKYLFLLLQVQWEI